MSRTNPKAKAAPRAEQIIGESNRAMLARAEQIIVLLGGDYVVCEGWKMDKEAATRTLRYLRKIAAGAPVDDQEWEAACMFFYSHGQSIDWIARGDPGVMICRRASHSARARALKCKLVQS
jgi:hypothetical protein